MAPKPHSCLNVACNFQSSCWTSVLAVRSTFLHDLFSEAILPWPLWFWMILFPLMGCSFSLRPLDIGISLEFEPQMGYRWTKFCMLVGWSHRSQGVCNSPGRLRTPDARPCVSFSLVCRRDVVSPLTPWCLLLAGPWNPGSWASLGTQQGNSQESFLFPVPPFVSYTRIFLLPWGRSLCHLRTSQV